MKNQISRIVVIVFVLSVFFCRATNAEEFPADLRTVAKCLADELYPDIDAAMKERNQQEVRLEMQTHKFDLAKVKSENAEIQHLATEALAAVTDEINRLETIDNLPKPNNWKVVGASFLDGFLLGYGLPPTGTSIETYQSENTKQEAIDNEFKGLVKSIKKAEIAQRLLPRIAKTYAATLTKSKNGERINAEFHEFPCAFDCLSIENIGENLSDCVIEVKITGEKGDTATSVFFLETWEKGTDLCTICAAGTEFDGEIILRRTAVSVKQVDLTLLSPKYSTSVQYQYGQAERDSDFATMFKDVKLTARYSEASEGIFDNWARSATIYMQGFSRLPPCKLSVTFDGEGQTYFASDSGWTAGNGWTIKGNNKLKDRCTSFSAEVTFPRTNFKIKETWQVNR
ncbi:MAG: hypothetical protein LBN39_05480 [Planctomycetaceae bacterium]|jgi:hypothetical protein|nr:hypothetical protein [Planctomycetaceae bacterium]